MTCIYDQALLKYLNSRAGKNNFDRANSYTFLSQQQDTRIEEKLIISTLIKTAGENENIPTKA